MDRVNGAAEEKIFERAKKTDHMLGCFWKKI